MGKNILTESKSVILTDATQKVPIAGQPKYYSVYRIPLTLLYYNDRNDRIASWISKYNSKGSNINELSRDEYNKEIEKYIIESNPSAFTRTMNNIKALGQMSPGVVLQDGRIIDGNRRYTCLRKLYEEASNEEFFYFEGIILDENIDDRTIKRLELELQHGQDDKVDYNPIDRLVGIYNDIIKNKMFTAKEYGDTIGISQTEVNKRVELAKLMVEFLEYINAPEQFYIARELDLDGPLNEIVLIQRRIKDEEKWLKAKSILFDNMLTKPIGDITRMIRDVGKIVDSDLFDHYFDKHEELSYELNDILKKSEIIDTGFINDEVRANEDIRIKLIDNYDYYNNLIKRDTARKLPITQMDDLVRNAKKIDFEAVSRLDKEDREQFDILFNELRDILENIKNTITRVG